MTGTEISAEKLQGRVRELEELIEISLFLNSNLDLDNVLKHILESSQKVLKAQAVSILLLDRKTGELFFRSALGGNADSIVPYRLKPGEGIAGAVVRDRQPVIVDDAQEDPRFARRFDRLSGFVTRSLLAVPMWCREDLTGVMELMNKVSDNGELGNFFMDDLHKAIVVANMAAVALENARLFQGLQESYSRVLQAEKSKEEFISIISHELRTPLVPIQGYAHLLRSKKDKLPEETQNEFLDEIIRQAQHLNMLIEDLFLVNGVEGAHFMVTASPAPFAMLVREALSIKEINSATHPVEMKVDPAFWQKGEPMLQVDKDKFVHLLAHLLDNAVKFSPNGGKITMGLTREGSEAVVYVEDQGIGVKEEFRERIFDRFFQGDSSSTRRFGGTGAGLFIVKKIAEAHGGSVACKPSHSQGTRIEVKLPPQALPQNVH